MLDDRVDGGRGVSPIQGIVPTEDQTGVRPWDQKHHTAFDDSPFAFTITSLDDGRLLDVNEGFVRMSGYTRDEAVGRTPDELGLWVEPDLRAERFRLLAAGAEVPDIETRFRIKGGEERIGVIASARLQIGDKRCVLSSVLDITDRRRAEQVLREREAEARQLLELNQAILANMAEGMYAVDTHGLVTYVNAEAERLLGWKSQDLLGRRMHDLTHYKHPDGSPFPIEECGGFKVLHEGRVLKNFEDTFIRKDGTFFPVSYSSSPLRNDDGGIVGLVVVFQDITERKRGEDALRESREELTSKLAASQRLQQLSVQLIREDNVEALYDEIIDAAVSIMQSDMASIHMFDPDRGTGGELRMLASRGFRPEAAKLWERVRPDSSTAYSAALQLGRRVIVPDVQTCDSIPGTDAVKAFGQAGIRACQSTPLVSRKGRVVGMISTYWRQPHEPLDRDLGHFDVLARQAADLLERSQAEAALRESEARIRAFADTAPAMLWVTGADGSSSFLSRGWYDFTGKTETEGLGFGWLNAVHPDDRAQADEVFCTANARHEPFALEYRLRHADGSFRWVFDAGRPRWAADGGFLGYIGSVIDITDRKQAEESLRASEAELRRASQIKDEFLATLSHELRTPLNAVLGWAQMLRTGTLNRDLADRALESLERNARAQAQLVEDLLDVSRIVSGKLEIKSDPVDLATVVAAAVDTIRQAAESKRVSLAVHADPANPVVVNGDPTRLRQIVWNLMSNAVKFTAADGNVNVILGQTGGHAEIVVRDSGEGIDKEFLPFVFDRFTQADGTTTRRHSGLGLGLAIVRHLTEAHAGTVTAESDGPNTGATFTVRLPLAVVRQSLPSDPLPGRGGPTLLEGTRILVVDDEPDARDLIRAMLESQGSHVMAVGSTAEALNALEHEPFHLLVADIGMPGEDGYALLRTVRGLRDTVRRIPAIAVTAYAGSVHRDIALAAGYTGHVAKPIEKRTLTAAIVTALESASSEPKPLRLP